MGDNLQMNSKIDCNMASRGASHAKHANHDLMGMQQASERVSEIGR